MAGPIVDTKMLAFADYLKSAAALITGETVDHLRAGTRALREKAGRVIPAVHAVEDLSFEGLRYRIVRPTERQEPPAVVFLHGGGWSHLDIDVYDPVIRRIALESGLTVAAIDFPLVPEVPFPGGLDCCVRFVRQIAGQRGGSVGLVGDSAGANLALAAALMLRDADESLVVSLALVYGVYDLVGETQSHRQHGDGSTPLTVADIRNSRAVYIPDAARRSHPLASPILADLTRLPPVFLAVASHDPLYDENIAMAGRLGQSGCAVTLHVYPNTIHGFLEAESVNGAAVASQALRDLGQFTARHASASSDRAKDSQI